MSSNSNAFSEAHKIYKRQFTSSRSQSPAPKHVKMESICEEGYFSEEESEDEEDDFDLEDTVALYNETQSDSDSDDDDDNKEYYIEDDDEADHCSNGPIIFSNTSNKSSLEDLFLKQDGDDYSITSQDFEISSDQLSSHLERKQWICPHSPLTPSKIKFIQKFLEGDGDDE